MKWWKEEESTKKNDPCKTLYTKHLFNKQLDCITFYAEENQGKSHDYLLSYFPLTTIFSVPYVDAPLLRGQCY